MRFLSIIISLAIVAYVASIYIDSGSMDSVNPDQIKSQPKEYIDQANKAADDINDILKKQKENIDKQLK